MPRHNRLNCTLVLHKYQVRLSFEFQLFVLMGVKQLERCVPKPVLELCKLDQNVTIKQVITQITCADKLQTTNWQREGYRQSGFSPVHNCANNFSVILVQESEANRRQYHSLTLQKGEGQSGWTIFIQCIKAVVFNPGPQGPFCMFWVFPWFNTPNSNKW